MSCKMIVADKGWGRLFVKGPVSCRQMAVQTNFARVGSRQLEKKFFDPAHT